MAEEKDDEVMVPSDGDQRTRTIAKVGDGGKWVGFWWTEVPDDPLYADGERFHESCKWYQLNRVIEKVPEFDILNKGYPGIQLVWEFSGHNWELLKAIPPSNKCQNERSFTMACRTDPDTDKDIGVDQYCRIQCRHDFEHEGHCEYTWVDDKEEEVGDD